jgi:hypothetical protein
VSRAWIIGHDATTHGARCFCGRRARWHVDGGVQGCANLCGIHARVVQRRSLWSAVFSAPIISTTGVAMPHLDQRKKDQLAAIADRVAEDLANEYGRARVSAPVYSAGDLERGGWSVKIVGLADDVERRAVRCFLDGTHEASPIRDASGDVVPDDAASRVAETAAGMERPGARHGRAGRSTIA